MDENTTVTNPTDSADAVSPKEKISVKFTGGDGSEGYKNGEVYTEVQSQPETPKAE
jgi:hypothetical protein